MAVICLEWCKSYDVLHTIKFGDKFIKQWDRLTFCRFVSNRTKIEFWNARENKRCRLSISAIDVICEDYGEYIKDIHKNLFEKIKGGIHNAK